MSGICGLFNLDGAPVAEAELHAMIAMLERRGPDRTGHLREGPAGLGHTLLASAPKLQFERQPYTHAQSGCVVTADVRLDNRDELLDALEIQEPSESVGDAALIVAAYLAWGYDCPERLLGDFAFTLWDPHEQKLVCARDHFGMRPFYYHHAPGQRFLFASDPRAILVLPQVPYRINDGRIADFLVPQLEWFDYTSTFFEEVYRLPPGHTATLSRNRLIVEEYWRPEPGPELGPMSDDDYREGFVEVYTRSVESRLHAPAAVTGSMLSGGVDSGSVVAVAKELLASSGSEPLHTYSAIRRQADDCAESRAIRAAIAMPSLSPTLVYLDDIGEHLEPLISGNGEPFDGQATLLKAIYLAAGAQGRRVLLDGAGGDVVLGEGSYIARLLRRGHFIQALREIHGETRFWGGATFGSTLFNHAAIAFVPEPLKTSVRGLRRQRRIQEMLAASLISSDLATDAEIEGRFHAMWGRSPDGWQSNYAAERCNVIRPSVTAGRERYGRLAAASGMEACDPFLDKRVVDYCTRLPGRIRMRDGWPKIILRDVMADRLPDAVRWARGKPHLGWRFNARITREALQAGRLNVADLQTTLDGYADFAALADAWRRFQDGGDAEEIHSAYVLSVWLRENAQRPVVPG